MKYSEIAGSSYIHPQKRDAIGLTRWQPRQKPEQLTPSIILVNLDISRLTNWTTCLWSVSSLCPNIHWDRAPTELCRATGQNELAEHQLVEGASRVWSELQQISFQLQYFNSVQFNFIYIASITIQIISRYFVQPKTPHTTSSDTFLCLEITIIICRGKWGNRRGFERNLLNHSNRVDYIYIQRPSAHDCRRWNKQHSLSLWPPEAKHLAPEDERLVKDFMVLTTLTAG